MTKQYKPNKIYLINQISNCVQTGSSNTAAETLERHRSRATQIPVAVCALAQNDISYVPAGVMAYMRHAQRMALDTVVAGLSVMMGVDGD